MTDRLKGFTVVLTTDICDQDAEQIVHAIQMIKGVLDVSPVTADSEDWMNRTRIRFELEREILSVLHRTSNA